MNPMKFLIALSISFNIHVSLIFQGNPQQIFSSKITRVATIHYQDLSFCCGFSYGFHGFLRVFGAGFDMFFLMSSCHYTVPSIMIDSELQVKRLPYLPI